MNKTSNKIFEQHPNSEEIMEIENNSQIGILLIIFKVKLIPFLKIHQSWLVVANYLLQLPEKSKEMLKERKFNQIHSLSPLQSIKSAKIRCVRCAAVNMSRIYKGCVNVSINSAKTA